MSDNSVTLQIRATNLSAAAFKELVSGLKEVGATSDSVSERGKSSWTEMFTAMAAGELVAHGIEAAFRSAGELLAEIPAKILELGQRGTEVSEVEESFHRLNEAIGEVADDSLSKMRTAFGGTVTDFDLMKGANKALQEGIPITGDELATLAQSARITGAALGVNAKEQWDKFITAIATGREKGLRGAGLDLAALKRAVEEHANALGTDTAHLSDHEHALAVRNAVLEQSTRLIDENGKHEQSFADNVQAARVQIQNWKDELGIAIAKSPAVKVAMDEMSKAFIGAFGNDRQAQIKTLTGYVNTFAIGTVTGADYVVSAVDEIGGAFLGLPLIWNSLLGSFNTFEAGLDSGLLKVLDIMRSVPGQSAAELKALDEVINKVKADQTNAAVSAGIYQNAAEKNRASIFDWTVTMNGAHKTLGDLKTAMVAASKTTDDQTAARKRGIQAERDYGDAVKGANDEQLKAKKEVSDLTAEIDKARDSGMTAGQIYELFGKKALTASEDARRAGVASSNSIETVATEASLMKLAFDNAADSGKKMWEALANNPASKAALEYEKNTIDIIGQVIKSDQDQTIAHASGTQARILQIQQETQAQIDAVNKMGGVDAEYKTERIAQIKAIAQEQIDAAHGTYDSIVALEKASGVQTVASLRETANQERLLYEQMRDSGAFSAADVQQAWENSVKAQAKAVGGLKGDLLAMYGDLSGQLSSALADMATHWKNWRGDLKKIWSDIEGDFASVLASMLKRWIEGFLMKMLDGITGSRGEFASAWASVMPQGGGGGYGGGGYGGGGGGGGGASSVAGAIQGYRTGGWSGAVKGYLGMGTGVGAGVSVVGGTAIEAGIPVFSTAAGLGANATSAAMAADPALAGATPGAAGAGGAGAIGILGGGLMAAQGLYTMWKAKTRAQNVVGGMETGAGIGTMILPGIGTIVGAGIGALAGLIKSFFGVSQKEKDARASVASFQHDTFSNLSADQAKEAQGAVASGAWKDPQAAGTLIAVRDAYIAIGKTSQDAERDVKALWDSEKKGPEATTAAMQPLLAALEAQKKKQTDVNAAVSAAKAKYAELADGIKAKMSDLNKSIADLDASEKPEKVMGVIEKAQREAFAKQKQVLEAALEANNKAAADAVEKAKKDATVASTTIGTQVAHLPEQFANSGRESWARFSKEFDGREIHIPVVADMPDGSDGTMPMPPIPRHAKGGLFTRAHIAWFAEAGKPEIGGDIDFMTRALTGAVQKATGVIGSGGGGMDPQGLFEVLHDAFVAALHTTGLASLGSNSGQQVALNRVWSDGPRAFKNNEGGIRTALRLHAGATA